MKILKNIFFIFFLNYCTAKYQYDWVIVGGGPAGIVTIGVLLDLGIQEDSICWIDPQFNVGRIGEFYSNVPANSPNHDFIKFLKSCKTFNRINTPAINYLNNASPNEYSTLKIIIEPLQEITNYLLTIINSFKCYINCLEFYNDVWHIGINNKIITAKNIVLATGCLPRKLDYSCDKTEIPLDLALDQNNLNKLVNPCDSIAIFGSAHSAVLIMKYLSEFDVTKIINFYRTQIIYANGTNGELLNPHSGLRGVAAKWAREILEKNPPKNLYRYENNNMNRNLYLPGCNKIIYAAGYERNTLPEIIIDSHSVDVEFNSETGTLGPRIFGIGIAFPYSYISPSGNTEQAIGINSFLLYAQSMLPNWISKDINEMIKVQNQIIKLSEYENLFDIQIL